MFVIQTSYASSYFTDAQVNQICSSTGFPTAYKGCIDRLWDSFLQYGGFSSIEWWDVNNSMANGKIPGLFFDYLSNGKPLSSDTYLPLLSQMLRAIYGEVSDHPNTISGVQTKVQEVYGIADCLTNRIQGGLNSSYQNALTCLDMANPAKRTIYHKGIYLTCITDVCQSAAYNGYAAAWREARALCYEPRYAPRLSSLPTSYYYFTDVKPSTSGYYTIGRFYFKKTL
jgi:hypothetical protein